MFRHSVWRIVSCPILSLSLTFGSMDLSAQISPRPGCMNDYFERLEFSGPLMPINYGPGDWEWSAEFSPISERVTFFACLPSVAPNDLRSDVTYYPSLFLICGIDAMDAVALVVAGYDVRRRTAVLSAFDDDAGEASDWTSSLRKRAIFAPESSEEFAQKLVMHDELSVQITLRDRDVINVSYDLRGASEALDVLRQACKWRIDK